MDIGLPPAIRANLLAARQTSDLLARTQKRLATGYKVNSALDNATSFFASRQLNNSASDLFRLNDSLGQNIQTIKTAQHGLDAIQKSLELAEALALNILDTGEYATATGGTTLNSQILARNPVGYWRLNDTAGSTAASIGSNGSINGTYTGGVTLNGSAIVPNGGDVAATFNGSGRINVPDSNAINLAVHAQRTIELVFNANTTAGRQVLYEEGATVNALNIYIDNGLLYVNGRDSGDWGPFNISQPINAGQTYHVALVLDQPNGTFSGYLDGNLMGTGTVTVPLSSHSGNIGIGGMNESSYFHDGPQSGNGLGFNGQIAEVALYNSVLSATEISDHSAAVTGAGGGLTAELLSVINGINDIAYDSHYRGVNLLEGDTMASRFNMANTSNYDTVGRDFTTAGLGIDSLSFEDEAQTRASLAQIRQTMATVRQYSASLSTSYSIIQSRQDHMQEMMNILQEGADKLTLADMNEEGANMLALQTRQQLSMSSLRSLSNANSAILQLFR